MKKNVALLMVLLVAGMVAGCSSDEKESQIISCFGDPEIVGKWQLVEIKDGPRGIRENGLEGALIEFSRSGTVSMVYADGHTEKAVWQKDLKAIDDLPVVYIGDNPFTYTMEGFELKLHYQGIYTTDHIPATFVLQQISDDEYNDIVFIWSFEKGEADDGLISRLGDNEPEFELNDFQTIQMNEEKSTNGTWNITKVNGVLSQIFFFNEGIDPAPSPASPQTEEEFFNTFLPVTADNRMNFYDRDYRDDPIYRQFYKGIPVEQGWWHISFLNGIMQGGYGRFIPIDDLNVYPAVNYATAKKIVENRIHDSAEGESKRLYLSIMSFPENGELKPRLVYVYKRQVWEEGEYLYVDAQTGRLLYHIGYEGGAPY